MTVHFSQDLAGRLREFQLRRVEHRVLGVGSQVLLGRRHLQDPNSIERPSMRLRDRLHLVFGFRKRDVQTLLSAPDSLPEELKGERGLPGARVAFDQEEPVGR